MAKLTAAARKKLPKSSFVEKGARKYPIPTPLTHAMRWRGVRKAGTPGGGCGSSAQVPQRIKIGEEIGAANVGYG